MSIRKVRAAVALAAALCAAGVAQVASGAEPARADASLESHTDMPLALRLDADRVQARVRELLAAYARNDADAVIALLDPRAITIYGSDAAEFYSAHDDVRRMMRDDFALWRTAEFGTPRDLSVRVVGDFATVFFHVPFRAGGGPEVLVRFATVWRRDGERWLLTQSANTVPTVGSSAADLLPRSAPRT